MFKRMREDIHSVFDRDPAARSTLEVLLCYAGLHALWGHRVSHWLWTHKLKLLARAYSQTDALFYRHRDPSRGKHRQAFLH